MAEQQSVVLAVYHNRRWDGDVLSVEKILRMPVCPIGRVVEFVTNYDRFRP
jgi:predicted dehydrogenase